VLMHEILGHWYILDIDYVERMEIGEGDS